MSLTQGSTTVERVNNAIVSLDLAAARPGVNAGVRKAVRQLAEHWVSYFNTQRRHELVPDVPKLKKYALWYARGYALMPPEQRMLLPDPRALDTSYGAAVEDQIKAILEGAQATTQTADGLKTYLTEQAKGLADEVGKRAEKVVQHGLVYAGIAALIYLMVRK